MKIWWWSVRLEIERYSFCVLAYLIFFSLIRLNVRSIPIHTNVLCQGIKVGTTKEILTNNTSLLLDRASRLPLYNPLMITKKRSWVMEGRMIGRVNGRRDGGTTSWWRGSAPGSLSNLDPIHLFGPLLLSKDNCHRCHRWGQNGTDGQNDAGLSDLDTTWHTHEQIWDTTVDTPSSHDLLWTQPFGFERKEDLNLTDNTGILDLSGLEDTSVCDGDSSESSTRKYGHDELGGLTLVVKSSGR